MSQLIDNEEVVKREMEKLKNEITLMIFTDVKTKDDGTKTRRCSSCETTLNLLNELAEFAGGKLKIKELSTEEDEELAEKFEIKRIPTILFLEEQQEELLRVVAEPRGGIFAPFLKTLQIYSGKHTYYWDAIKGNLDEIGRSNIKVFVTQTCPYCSQIFPIVTEFALEGDGKIKTEIIDVNANQDVALEYGIQGVPQTMVNEKERIVGMFNPNDLLEKLTGKVRRDVSAMYS